MFDWKIIALQCCVGFCHTSTWISHRYTYIPSLLNLPSISHPSRLSQSIKLSSVYHTEIPSSQLFYMWSCICFNALQSISYQWVKWFKCFCVFSFLISKKGDDDNHALIIGLLWCLNVIMHIRHLEEYLTFHNCSKIFCIFLMINIDTNEKSTGESNEKISTPICGWV